MAIYFGNNKVDPSGFSKVYVGNDLVYEAGSQPTYTYLEYIQSPTGSASGRPAALEIPYLGDYEFEFEAYLTQSVSNATFGSTNNNEGYYFSIDRVSAANPKWEVIHRGAHSYTYTSSVSILESTVFKYTNGVLYINDEVLDSNFKTHIEENGIGEKNLIIFGRNYFGIGGSAFPDIVVSYVKIFDPSTHVLLAHYKAARNEETGKVGLYDEDNDSFLYSTSGNYIAGPTQSN